LARGRIDASSPVAGTPAYMSPEQAAGRAPDPRSDLYSLGVVLYELAAGRRPFAEKSVEQMTRAHLWAEPPPLPRELPLDVRRAIMRLLAKDPEARFQSAAEAQEALAGSRRRRRLRVALVSGLMVLGALLLLRPRTPASLPPELWRPVLKTLSSQEENLDKPAVSPDGKYIAIPSTRGPGGNWDIWLSETDNPSRWRPLTQDPEADEDPQFIDQGRAVLFFSTRAGRSGLWRVEVARPGPPQFVTESARGSFAATLDGRKVLYQRTPRDLALLDLRTLGTKDVVHFPANEGFTDIAIDADGKRAVLGVRKSSEGGFFVMTRSDLYLVSLPGGEGKYLTTDNDFNCTASFIPDQPDALVVSSHRGGAQNLWKFFLDGRPPFQLTSGGGGDDVFPIMSPDGKRLFYIHDNTVTQLWLREPGGKEWRRLTGELIDHSGPTLDAKGRTLVYATYNRETGARQLMTATLPAFEPHPLGSYPQVLEPALTPDGKELLATRLDGEQRALVLLGAQGALIGMVIQGQSAPFCGGATLSADHAAIAFAHDRGDTGLYLLSRGGAATVLSRDVACYARFSPQKPNLLAYLRRTSPGTGQLELLDVQTGKMRVLAALPFDSTRVTWDPAGESIYVSDYENRVIRRLATADGKMREEITAPGDNLVAFAAGPNGLLVAEGSVGRTRLLAIENIPQSPR
ncbi:MAG TPA: protein kinase, partial [Polyangia bacterium]|nr:protein kinase [Polyangia bacterium]